MSLVLCSDDDMVEGLGPAAALGEMPPAAPSEVDQQTVETDPPAEAAAYVIYTSGSTGVPRGVAVPHHSLAAHCAAARRCYGLTPADRVLQFASVSFDVAAEELFPTWAAGGTVCMLPGSAVRASLGDLVEEMGRQEVTVANLPASVWHEWTLELAAGHLTIPSSLRLLVVGSETVRGRHLSEWRRRAGNGIRWINAYGLSETTVTSTVYELPPSEGAGGAPPCEHPDTVPIGRPLDGARVELLDDRLARVPARVEGEIFIAGERLARGYVANPRETAARFVPDPWARQSGSRMFRTGDLARRDEDEVLHFRGRRDGQVQIRGVRVEVGEVESVLLTHPAVRRCAVVSQRLRTGAERLVAWVVADGVAVAELRHHLARHLPVEMVPARVHLADTLPTTPGGKVDRRALAERAEAEMDSPAGLEADPPAGDSEEALGSLWSNLLQVDRVGRHDDFLKLGGNSLLVGRLLTRLAAELDVRLSAEDVFAHPTLMALARRIDQERGESGLPPVRRRDRSAGLPLSYQQEGLWLLRALDPESLAYNTQITIRLRGDLDLGAMVAALRGMVSRHEVFRSSFELGADGEPVQTPHADAEVSVPLLDLASLPPWRRDEEGERFVALECGQPFDINTYPLVRWRLIRRGGADHELTMVEHHFVHDGWSLALFLREFSTLYGDLASGRASSLPELEVQFGDFAAWQRENIAGERLARGVEWWRRRLVGAPLVLELPTDRPRPAAPSHRGKTAMVTIPSQEGDRLRALSSGAGVTLFATMLAGFQVLVHRYTDRRDMSLGSAFANRSHPQSEPLVGMLVNAVVLRNEVGGDLTFEELQRRVRDVVIGAYDHQEVPFEKVVEALQPERDPSRNPLFQVAFSFHDSQVPALRWRHLAGEILYRHNQSAKFDLNVVAQPLREQRTGLGAREEDGAILMEWEAALDLFDPVTIHRMIGHYRNLLAAAAARPGERLSALPLLGKAEQHQLTREWSFGPEPSHAPVPLLSRIRRHARLRPRTVAVVADDGRLTFGELDRWAGCLARELRCRGVTRGSVVGVAIGRGRALPVAILATLRAGGAFLPLDTADPADRLRFIVEDAGVSLVLTSADPARELPELSVPRLAVWPDLPAEPSEPMPPVTVTARDLAYVIYTSGSTGRPKGVEVSYGGIQDLLDDFAARAPLDAGCAASLWTHLGFDVSVYELFSALAEGCTLHLLPEEVRTDVGRLWAYLERHDVRSAYLPPFFLEPFLGWLRQGGESRLQRLLVGVEPLAEPLLAEIRSRIPGLCLFNGYGPTEATVCCTLYPVPLPPVPERRAPVGRPVRGSVVRVLDNELRPVPTGVVGQICIAGRGLARGYRGRPALTASSFVPDPLDGGGGRLYLTGDMARHGADGHLVFVERRDRQLKVRGFRVEPGEVESVLAAHPGVGRCAVVGTEDGGLAAFAVAAHDSASLDLASVRGHLESRLPAYLVPSVMVTLPELPLTPSGKTDRQSLRQRADEVGAGQLSRDDDGLPRTPSEALLASLWESVLGRDEVRRRAHFFSDLGGHSLLAMRVVMRIRDVFDVELPLREMFEAPTVAGLAAYLDSARAKQASGDGRDVAGPDLRRLEETRVRPSSAQERLWFLDNLLLRPSAYHIARAFRLRGSLDRGRLLAAWEALVQRHASLRTGIGAAGGGAELRPMERPASAAVAYVDLSSLGPSASLRAREAACGSAVRRRFALAVEHPTRLLILRQAADEHTLLLVVHHVAADGWSMARLLADLEALYREDPRDADLPTLEVRYSDYAVWQRRQLRGERLERLLTAWRRILGDSPTALDLPTDRPRPARQSALGRRLAFRLDEAAYQPLRRLARDAEVTPFVVLFAAFSLLLARYSGQGEVVVGTPVAGRIHPRLEHLVGLFVNSLALPVSLHGEPSVEELLRRVRASMLAAFDHRELPFERLVEELAPQRQLDRTPLFQALFAMQQPEQGLPLEGLDVEPVALRRDEAPFDLDLMATQADGGVDLLLTYSTDLFDQTSMERFAGSLLRLLTGFADAGQRPVSELPLLSAAQRHQVVHGWNDATTRPPRPRLLHHMARRWIRERPDWLAVRHGDEALTYAELGRRSDHLARRLRAAGVGVESRVGVHMPKGVDVLVTIQGVLMAGAAFVPLDPSYPRRRLVAMAADAGLAAVVERGEGPSLDLPAVRRLRLDEAEPSPKGEVLVDEVGPSNLAYVVFTSGSTGRPKGVGNHHDGIATLVADVGETWDVPAGEVHGQWASLSFDVSVYEIFHCLRHGGTLEVIPEEMRGDGPRLFAFLADRRVTTAYVPPYLLGEMLAWVQGGRKLFLRRLFVGVEPIEDRLLDALLRSIPGLQVLNTYGPSETSCAVTRIQAGAVRSARGRAPLGYPVRDTRLYVLDRGLEPLPIGVTGHLHVAGRSVGRGYLGLSGQTAAAFVPDPLSRRPGSRMYRTGDRVRHLPEGALEFVGRVDRQLNLRGVRAEPGEVESTLVELEGVSMATVRVVPDGDRLVAYVVAEEGRHLDPQQLRQALQGRLPPPLVPSVITVLDTMPLTPSGKVDRSALPAPVVERGRTPPGSETERQLAAVWADLLDVEAPTLEDDFFHLGGHSLLALKLVSRLRGLMGVELDVRSVFEAPSLGAMAWQLEKTHGRGGGVVPRAVADRSSPMPLSPAQRRLWFLSELEPDNPVYHVPVSMAVEGPVDIGCLSGALVAAIRRHEALRTRYENTEEGPRQVVAPPPSRPLSVVDLSALARRVGGEAADVTASRAVSAVAERPFDLRRQGPVRCALVTVGPARARLVINVHHISTDGWSTRILLREIGDSYAALVAERWDPRPPFQLQYGDFAIWQRRWLASGAEEEQANWWRRKLEGLNPLELPSDRPRSALWDHRGDEVRGHLLEGGWQRLQEVGNRWGATPFQVLLTVFGVVLTRWSGQRDVTVGTAVANRRWQEIEDVVGYFANTLALRQWVDESRTLTGQLETVRDITLGAYDHQDLPFERLVELLQPERSLVHNPLFQVMLVVHSTPLESLQLVGAEVRESAVSTGRSRFDLTLMCRPENGGMTCRLEYSRELFDASTMERLLGHYGNLLERTLDEPTRPLRELSLLSPAESCQLTGEWARGPDLPTGGGTVPERFHRQARLRADAVAVVGAGGGRLTYGALARRASTLAAALGRRGVGPGVVVGIYLDRSPLLVWSLLAVLEAGGTYVSLDPEYPAERLEYISADAGVELLLTRRSLREKLARQPLADRVSSLEVDRLAEPSAPATPRCRALPRSLAYLLYTSGSTGQPKGVAIEHRSVAALMDWAGQAFSTAELAAVFAGTSINFDLSVFEIFVPLVHGGSVIVGRDATSLVDMPEAADATLVNTVPSVLSQLLRVGDLPKSVHTVNLAGEPLSRGLVDEVRARAAGSVRVLNLYGPSEDTTYSVWEEVGAGEGLPAIGAPVAGTRAYVLDQRLQPVPVGVAGELCLGGAGLARGYHGRGRLTAASFVPDPFGGRPGGRLYRTGDLCRWLPGGRLGFIGRRDHQVKLRGFRIELGEVEVCLAAHPAIVEAACVVDEGATGAGSASLVAFLVPEAGRELPTDGEVREAAARRLPPYMVPDRFVGLAEMPLTPNGKLDRRALMNLAPKRRDAAPSRGLDTPLEVALAELWQRLLSVDRVGPEDDFFSLGGHSLLALRMLGRVRRDFRVDLPLRSAFELPTLAALAKRIEQVSASGDGSAEAGRLRRREFPGTAGRQPVSDAQRRLWFLEKLASGGSVYHVTAAFRLCGQLDTEALAAALRDLERRHESLRAVFEEAGGRLWQRYPPASQRRLSVLDFRQLGSRPGSVEAAGRKALARAAGQPFDLGGGPPWRTVLARITDAENLLLFAFHHIVIDGWSVGVLFRELEAFYEVRRAGRQPAPAPLELRYADYAAWQRERLDGGDLDEGLEVWRQRLTGVRRVDHPPDHWLVRNGVTAGRISFTMSAAKLSALRALAHRHGATLFMVLLTAWSCVLARRSDRYDLTVGTPVANRIRPELEDLVGVFVNTLVLRVDLGGDPSLREVLERVREVTLEAFEHGEVPFERLVEELSPRREADRQPLFQTMMALHNEAPGQPTLAGLDVEHLEIGKAEPRFDLFLNLLPTGDGSLDGYCEYSADRFDGATVEHILAGWETVLSVFLEEDQRPLSRIPLSAGAELHQVTEERPSGLRGGIVGRVAAQALRAPGVEAVVAGDASLSFRSLVQQAERWAASLRLHGLGPGSLLGLWFMDATGWVPAALGTLAVGASYLVVEAGEDPEARLGRAGVDALACDLERSSDLSVPILRPGSWDGPRVPLADHVPLPEGRACVVPMDRSDSASLIEIPHLALDHSAHRLSREFELGPGDRWAGIAASASAPLALEAWAPLVAGATLCVSGEGDAAQPAAVCRWLRSVGATVTSLPTALAEEVTAGDAPAGLRVLRFGGAPPRRGLTADAPFSLIHWHGFPEAAGAVVSSPLAAGRPFATLPPAGRPTVGADLHVLDRFGNRCAVGVAGELHVGGPGVGQGYLGEPGRTAEQFRPHPGDHPGARLFASGDRARWQPDGTLEVLGRMGSVRVTGGVDAEPRVVEAVLREHPGLEGARVTANGGELVAHVIAAGTVTEAGLIAFAAGHLPPAMVPSRIFALDAFPLCGNGELDEAALPYPEPENHEAGVPPRGRVEKRLAAVWGRLLGNGEINRDDDFFNLGGHSLLALELIAEVGDGWGVRLPLRTVFDAPTLRQFARRVEAAQPSQPSSVIPRLQRVEENEF